MRVAQAFVFLAAIGAVTLFCTPGLYAIGAVALGQMGVRELWLRRKALA